MVVPWFLRNRYIGGNAIDRSLMFNGADLSLVTDFLKSLTNVFYLGSGAIAQLISGVCFIVIICIFVGIRGTFDDHKRLFLTMVLVSAAVYVILLTATHAYVDPKTILEFRQLVPFFYLFFLLSVPSIYWAWRALRSVTVARMIVVIGLVFFVTQIAGYMMYFPGFMSLQKRWVREFTLIREAVMKNRALLQQSPIVYSNVAEGVYFATGMRTTYIPAPPKRDADPRLHKEYEEQMTDLVHNLDRGAVIMLVDHWHDSNYYDPYDDIRGITGLSTVHEDYTVTILKKGVLLNLP